MRRALWFLTALALALTFTCYVAVVERVPLFSDGAQFGAITRSIVDSGLVPTRDPVGLLTMNNMAPYSLSPFTYQPGYFVLTAGLAVVIGDEALALTVLALVGAAVSVVILFLVLGRKKNAIVAAVLLLISPSLLWLTMHRIMEPIMLAVTLACVWVTLRYKRNFEPLMLLAILLAFLFSIKYTAYFVVAAFIVFFSLRVLLRRIQVSQYVAFCALFLLLILPTAYFLYSSTGSLLPSSQWSTPFIDEHTSPWWTQPRTDLEELMSRESQHDTLVSAIRSQDSEARQQTLLSKLVHGDPGGALQFFSLWPISSNPRVHYYSPVGGQYFGMFLLFFTIGAILVLRDIPKQFTSEKLLLLLLALFATVAFCLKGDLRYGYFLPVLSCGLLANAFVLSFRTNRTFANIALLVLMLSCTFIAAAEVNRDIGYRNTISHTGVRDGGLDEIISASYEYDVPANTRVFTPSSEIAYYMNTPVIWNPDVFFVSRPLVVRYFQEHNVSYIAIPFYSLMPAGSDWLKLDSIPAEAPFARMIADADCFSLLNRYKAFALYNFTCSKGTTEGVK